MQFKEGDAGALLAPCGLAGYLTIESSSVSNGNAKTDARPAGVWPTVEFDPNDPYQSAESEFFQWRPVQVFADDPDPPDVSQTPLLPFPFTERHLAAFMLEGVGGLVADHYGEWSDGPAPERLEQVPKSKNRARAAVRAAYSAFREASTKVGPRGGLAEIAEELCRRYSNERSAALVRERVPDAYPQSSDSRERQAEMKDEYQRRKMLALAPLKELEEEMQRAQAEAKAADEAWLKAMVIELLGPGTEVARQETIPTSHLAPSASPAPSHHMSAPIAKRYRRRGWRETAAFDYVVAKYKTIMPAPFKDLLRILESADGDVAMRQTRGGFEIVASGKRLTSKTLETDFIHIREAARPK